LTTKVLYYNLLGPRLLARDVDRQVVDVLVRVAAMDGFIALCRPIAMAVG